MTKKNPEVREFATESGLPNPAKFMNQVIRGSAYTFVSAIADLVDNSIEAGATNVYIDVNLEKLQVTIVDDGKGMDDATHFESMKIAAETREYSEEDLGKYGTGMKAASLSQAKCVTVATRTKANPKITVRRIDMDHIQRTNDWNRLTLVLDEEDLPEGVRTRLAKHQGTAVVWDDLDRVFVNNTLTAVASKEELRKHVASSENHLAMTFHRFLSGSIEGQSKLNIFMNGQEIEPWDPFARQEPARTVEVQSYPVTINGTPIKLVGYVLPGEKEFSSKEAFKNAGGPDKWVKSQGFWVYRNHRLIRGGGWLRMRSPDPHMSLARIAIEFPSSLDSVFQVNVAKSKIDLPKAIIEKLDPFVTTVIGQAKKRYGNQSNLALLRASGLPTKGLVEHPVVVRKMTARALADLIEKVAKASGLTSEFNAINKALREQNEKIADEIGW